MEQSGLEPWPGTLGCDPGKDTKLSQSLSPARFFGTGELKTGGNTAMDWHPIQGGCGHATKTRDKRWPDEPLGL